MKYVKLIALIMAVLLCTAVLADLSGLADVGSLLEGMSDGHDHGHGSIVRPAPDDEEQPEAEKSTVYYTGDGVTFKLSPMDIEGSYGGKLFFTSGMCECGVTVYFVPGDYGDVTSCSCPICGEVVTLADACATLNDCNGEWVIGEPCAEEHNIFVCSACDCAYFSHYTIDYADQGMYLAQCKHCGGDLSVFVPMEVGTYYSVSGKTWASSLYQADLHDYELFYKGECACGTVMYLNKHSDSVRCPSCFAAVVPQWVEFDIYYCGIYDGMDATNYDYHLNESCSHNCSHDKYLCSNCLRSYMICSLSGDYGYSGEDINCLSCDISIEKLLNVGVYYSADCQKWSSAVKSEYVYITVCSCGTELHYLGAADGVVRCPSCFVKHDVDYLPVGVYCTVNDGDGWFAISNPADHLDLHANATCSCGTTIWVNDEFVLYSCPSCGQDVDLSTSEHITHEYYYCVGMSELHFSGASCNCDEWTGHTIMVCERCGCKYYVSDYDDMFDDSFTTCEHCFGMLYDAGSDGRGSNDMS